MKCQRELRKSVIIGFFVLCLAACQILQAEDLMYSLEELGCAECNAYQLDFLYLVKLLQDSHPNVYANFPKAEFEHEKARLLKEFETIDDSISFALQLQQFCAQLSDAHTEIELSPLFRSGSIFPIGLTVLREDFYLTAYPNKFDHSFSGAKILSVNGIPMPQVIQQLGHLVSCENEISRLRQVCHILQIPKILHFMHLLNEEDSLPLTINTLEGTELTVVFPAQALRQVKNTWVTPPRNSHPVTAYQEKVGFSYRLLPDKGLCYFQWNACRDRQAWTFLLHTMGAEQFTRSFGLTVKDIEQYEDFRQMLSQMFTDMQNHQIHSLVIDLRHNKGGQSIFSYQFLYYLQQLPEVLKDYTGGIQLSPLLQHFNPTYFEEKKQEYEQVLGKEIVNLPVFSVEQSLLTGKQSGHPYTRSRQEFFAEVENPGSLFYIAPPIPRFSGRIFLLIGPKTASSAAYFATIMADNHLATLIGQPLGQKPTHFGDALLFQLPHTGIKGMVSSSLFLRPDATKNDESTLYPDIEVWPTIDDIMNGRDPVFDKVLELIEQEQEP